MTITDELGEIDLCLVRNIFCNIQSCNLTSFRTIVEYSLKKILPGDTCTEEEEDTDADNHADGKGVKPASSSTTSSPPVPPVVAPAVGRCLSTNILKIKLFLFGIDVIIWNILNDGKHYLP